MDFKFSHNLCSQKFYTFRLFPQTTVRLSKDSHRNSHRKQEPDIYSNHSFPKMSCCSLQNHDHQVHVSVYTYKVILKQKHVLVLYYDSLHTLK